VHTSNKPSTCSFGWWLVLICAERKVLLATCRWLVLADKLSEQADRGKTKTLEIIIKQPRHEFHSQNATGFPAATNASVVSSGTL
jgi:hypothetical protein